ncbi:MAG: Double zinc ribbon [Gaiellaceae bacterium]|nr:Double zinc ribbon [Gaiellaceae bacterium]
MDVLPPDDPAAPPPPGPPAGENVCPRCGLPYAPGQEYCLECGLRLPSEAGVVGTLSTAWRRRLPWYPGDWVWPVVLGLVVAAIAALAAIALTGNDNKGSTIVATGASTGSITTTTTAATTTVPTTTSAPPTTTTAPPPPPKPTLASWPDRNGWTVVLNSIPKAGGRAQATTEAKKALAAGLKPAGVIDSDTFSSLHPGYYVVFSGIFGTQGEALDAAATAHAKGYATAYARPVVR